MKAKNEEELKSWVPTIFLSPQKNLEALRSIQLTLYSNPQNTNNILNFNLLLGFLIFQHA